MNQIITHGVAPIWQLAIARNGVGLVEHMPATLPIAKAVGVIEFTIGCGEVVVGPPTVGRIQIFSQLGKLLQGWVFIQLFELFIQSSRKLVLGYLFNVLLCEGPNAEACQHK